MAGLHPELGGRTFEGEAGNLVPAGRIQDRHRKDGGRGSEAVGRCKKSGDLAAIKVSFGSTGQSCKSCHDNFRNR
ncbi:cytochrome c [Undibacterium arcticum]